MDKNIQWFPGHIAKGKNDILQLVKNVDVLVEVLDSRAIFSSKQDEYLKGIISNKKVIYVLNKSDLADKKNLKDWISHFKEDNILFSSFDYLKSSDVNSVLKIIKDTSEKIRLKYEKKGIKNKIVRCLIFGIPNVGKSTLINRLIHKKHLVTKNMPGVTRKINQIKLDNYTWLFDTAGILPTKFEDQNVGKNLCLINSISSKVFPYNELGEFLFDYLKKYYKKELCSYAKVDEISTYRKFILDFSLNRKMNIKSDNELNKILEVFIHDFEIGKIGKISLEKWNKTLMKNFIKNTNL